MLQSDNLPKGARKTPRALSALSGNAAAASLPRTTNASLSSLLETVMNEIPSNSPTNSLRKSSSKTSLLSSPTKKNSTRHKMVRLASVPVNMTGGSSVHRRATSESDSVATSNITSSSSPAVNRLTTKPFITIYDATKALFFDVDLAKRYTVQGSSRWDICRHNAKAAFELNYPDLGKMWLLASRFESLCNNDDKAQMELYLNKVAKSKECKLKYSEKLLCSCATPAKENFQEPSSVNLSGNKLFSLISLIFLFDLLTNFHCRKLAMEIASHGSTIA